MSVHLITINSNGQITIPSKYRKIWNLKANSKIKVEINEKKQISIVDEQNFTLDDLPQIIGKVKPISSDKINHELKSAFKPSKI